VRFSPVVDVNPPAASSKISADAVGMNPTQGLPLTSPSEGKRRLVSCGKTKRRMPRRPTKPNSGAGGKEI
jgi:hypothetical protein